MSAPGLGLLCSEPSKTIYRTALSGMGGMEAADKKEQEDRQEGRSHCKLEQLNALNRALVRGCTATLFFI